MMLDLGMGACCEPCAHGEPCAGLSAPGMDSPGSLSPAAIQHLGGLGFMGGLGGINDPDPEDEPGLYDKTYAWLFGDTGVGPVEESGYPAGQEGVLQPALRKIDIFGEEYIEPYVPEPPKIPWGKIILGVGAIWLGGRFIEGLGKGVGGRR